MGIVWFVEFTTLFGLEGLVMKPLSDNEGRAFQVFFFVWWSAVRICVPCKHRQDSPFLLQCAFSANRIDMIGITVHVIWYSYHPITPKALVSSYFVMAIACGLHVAVWLWVSFEFFIYVKFIPSSCLYLLNFFVPVDFAGLQMVQR
jgi:hypothetical protein